MPLHIAHWRVLLRGAVAAGPDTTPPAFGSGEEGDVSHATVVVTFSENIVASNYATGWTFKYAGVGQTINSATRQSNEAVVHFVLAADPGTAEAITAEYADVTGDYADGSGNQLGDVSATAVVNNIGTHAIFDNAADSGHALVTLRL